MYFIHQDLIALKIEKKKKIEITKKIKKVFPNKILPKILKKYWKLWWLILSSQKDNFPLIKKIALNITLNILLYVHKKLSAKFSNYV